MFKYRNLSESHEKHDCEINIVRAAAEEDAAKCSEDIVHDLDSKFYIMLVCSLKFSCNLSQVLLCST